MQTIDVVKETPVSNTIRARQVRSLFDLPDGDTASEAFRVELPTWDDEWKVGLIVGPSGSGKSTIAREAFGSLMEEPSWSGLSLVDDFAKNLSIQDIGAALSSVGLNTIPSWTRPFQTLSNGEQFRAMTARILAERDRCVVDEFTSVVDRQVAQIASHAVQKAIRKSDGKKFVAVTCHYDVIEWLQPDWILDMADRQFSWRSLRRRPELQFRIERCEYSEWTRFSRYHYMSQDLNRSAKCFAMRNDRGDAVAFAGVLPKPVSSGRDKGTAIWGVSRLVTLPDWQGMGLAMALCDSIGSLAVARGSRFRMYPAHFSLIRSFQRSPQWVQTKIQGQKDVRGSLKMGGSRCAVFEYTGQAHPSRVEAARIWEGAKPVK